MAADPDSFWDDPSVHAAVDRTAKEHYEKKEEATFYREVDTLVSRHYRNKEQVRKAVASLQRLLALQVKLEEKYPTRRYRDRDGTWWTSKGEWEADQLWRQAASDLGIEVTVQQVSTDEDEADFEFIQ